MNAYLNQLKTELAAYEARCGGRTESVLDVLWYCYTAAVPLDDGEVRRSEQALEPVFRELSVEASDALFDRISDLCLAYQRAAFLDGLQTGVHLMEQLHTA